MKKQNLFPPDALTLAQVFNYETRSDFFIAKVKSDFFHNWYRHIFARRVKRKYEMYLNRVKLENSLIKAKHQKRGQKFDKRKR